MIKQLLVSVAVAAMAFSVSAEPKVLWEAPSAEGVLAGWGNPVFTLDADGAAQIKAGDNIVITVASADKSLSDYPQVAINPGTTGGWPPAQNAIVNDPCEVKFGITPDLANQIHENGISFYGDATYLSKVVLEEGTLDVGPNTVWFGPKQCGWGDPAAVGKDVFADVKAGDVIKVNYDTTSADPNCNILFGGWNGLSINKYSVSESGFITDDQETGWYTIVLPENGAKFEWTNDSGTKEYDIFALLKDGGLLLQGPCIFNLVDFIPATGGTDAVNAIDSEDAPAVYYNLQGVKVANPIEGNIYIVKKGNKSSKKVF